jgi:3-oxoacyl-[acyl-carrier protein] reductase
MDLDLKGRHALVCGASAGIGYAAAVELARLGATVTPLSRSAERLKEVEEDLRRAGAAAAHALVADLDDRPSLHAKVEAHIRKHGDVHILVNNQSGPPHGPLLEAREEALLHAFGRIQLASHQLVQQLLPGMRKAGYGRIVNVLSTSVREPIPGLGIGNMMRASMAAWAKTVREPIPGLGVSGTIRSAMANWAKTLSRELPPGITINSVLPGYTQTERLTELADQMASRQGKDPKEIERNWVAVTPEGRLGRPEELGAVIAFLCSPAASFVRGQAWAVDGGRLNAT